MKEIKKFEVIQSQTLCKTELVKTDDYALIETFDWDAKDGKAYEVDTDETDWGVVFGDNGIMDIPQLLDAFVELIDEHLPTATGERKEKLEYLKNSCKGWQLEDWDYSQVK